jgi:signal peptidase II
VRKQSILPQLARGAERRYDPGVFTSRHLPRLRENRLCREQHSRLMGALGAGTGKAPDLYWLALQAILAGAEAFPEGAAVPSKQLIIDAVAPRHELLDFPAGIIRGWPKGNAEETGRMRLLFKFTGLRCLWVSVIVILFDQATKSLVTSLLIPSLNLTLTFNEGSAMGIIKSGNSWLLAVISILVTGVLLHLLKHQVARSSAVNFSLALIIGGAIGNLIDRVRLGRVIDFIHVYWHHWSFWIFNIAYASVSVGVLLLLLARTVDGWNRVSSR